MDLIGYLSIFRRRWLLILGVLGVTMVGTWVSTPSTTATTSSMSYSATATLIFQPSVDGEQFSLPTLALLTRVGQVPARAAERLGYTGAPQVLASTVTTSADSATNTLTITSTGDDGATVARTVNTFSQELISFLERKQKARIQSQLDALETLLTQYSKDLDRLDDAVTAQPNSSLIRADRDDVRARYADVAAAIGTARDSMATAQSPISVLQPGVAVPEKTVGGFSPPSNARGRLLVGGVVGLVLGAALALVVERIDTRLRTREQVEENLHLPVLAEIPALPWRLRHSRTVLSATHPDSPTAEAYRRLRSAVLRLRPREDAADGPHQVEAPSVVLVTSARPDEGKSATVANLAAVMAETGRRVLVLSMDFRNPQIQEYLDVKPKRGLSDLLARNQEQELADVVRATRVPGVKVATSGSDARLPGALISGSEALISRARELADIVLIDTAPLLAVSDALDLSPHVDAVLVVTRHNRTTTGQARAAHRLVSRLGVPAIGAIFVGMGEGLARQQYPDLSDGGRRPLRRLGLGSLLRRRPPAPDVSPQRRPAPRVPVANPARDVRPSEPHTAPSSPRTPSPHGSNGTAAPTRAAQPDKGRPVPVRTRDTRPARSQPTARPKPPPRPTKSKEQR